MTDPLKLADDIEKTCNMYADQGCYLAVSTSRWDARLVAAALRLAACSQPLAEALVNEGKEYINFETLDETYHMTLGGLLAGDARAFIKAEADFRKARGA